MGRSNLAGVVSERISESATTSGLLHHDFLVRLNHAKLSKSVGFLCREFLDLPLDGDPNLCMHATGLQTRSRREQARRQQSVVFRQSGYNHLVRSNGYHEFDLMREQGR